MPDGNIVSFKPFIDGIRGFNSPHPEALPQRSRLKYVDELRPSRDINRKLYSNLKKVFVNEHIFRGKANKPGFYFFIQLSGGQPKFYYIGISGTKKDQRQALLERIDGHIKNKDIIFYAVAFPQHREKYYNDTITFYENGKYSSHADEYRKQFDGLDVAEPEYIAWISHDGFTFSDRHHVETHFISEFQPPVNHRKKNEMPLPEYRDKYKVVRDYLFDHLIASLS